MSHPPYPRPAALSDFDDALGIEKQETILEARTGRSTIVRQPNPPSRVPSQSGGSRTRSDTVAGQSDLTVRSRAPLPPAPMVQIGRSTSRSGSLPMAPPPPRTSSNPRRPSGCSDPTCHDPNCQSVRNTERRYVLQRPMPQPIQTSAPMHSQPAVPGMRTEIPGVTPHTRANSFATRPQSWAGGPYTTSFANPLSIPPTFAKPQSTTTAFINPLATAAPRGPPPSPSAYVNMNSTQQWQAYQRPAQHAAAPTYAASTAYIPPPSTIYAASTSPTFHTLDTPSYMSPPAAGWSTTARARPLSMQPPVNEMYNPRLTSYMTQTSPVEHRAPMLVRSSSISARYIEPLSMPGTFPADDVIDDDRYYDDYGHSPTKRDSKFMPPPRRPVEIISRASARTPPQSRHYITEGSSHVRSRSYVDSDRTPRPSDIRRQSSTTSSRSRHHSVSTATSSNRTPATTISNESRGTYVTIEDRHGRRRQYLSAEDHARLKRFQAQQRAKAQKYADAEAYQNDVRGYETEDLTAENIRQMFDQPPSAPRSQVSGHSRRSSQSGARSEGIKISYGETTMHVVGGARVEMQNDGDGGPRIVINPGLGRDHPYYTETSKSSESRHSKSRVDNQRDRRSHSDAAAAIT